MSKSANQKAAQELLDRRKARTNIYDYIKYLRPAGLVDTKYDPAAHHRVFLDYCMKMAKRDADATSQLMVAMPPGGGKSILLSILLPTFLLAQDPTLQILCVTNSDSLSEKFSRQRREIMRTPQWQKLAQTSLQKDAQSLSFTATPEGGYIRSASVGASIMGIRCDVLLVDDLITSLEQANSIGQLQKMFDWYEAAARTRLKPKGLEIILSTRWSTADITGRFLERKESGEEPDWKYIRIPMICDDINDPVGREIGQRLWPEWFTPKMVEQAQSNPLLWKVLYQQQPSDDYGQWVPPEHFLKVKPEDIPNNLTYIIGTDLALTIGKGDYSVAVVAGLDENRELYVVEMFRSQCATHTFAQEICRLTNKYKPVYVLSDNDNASKMFTQTLLTESRKTSDYVPWVMLPIGNRNKEDRASILRAMMMQDQVKFKHVDWANIIYEEVLAFPSPSVHDDIIDSLSLIARQLNKLSAPSKKAAPERIKTQMQLGENGQIQMTESLDQLFEHNEALSMAGSRSFKQRI